jgi:hypothetical protein
MVREKAYYYRILLDDTSIPERIRGIEVKNMVLKLYLLIVKWVGCEIIVKSFSPIHPDLVNICFYTEEDSVYRKLEGKIKDIQQMRTFKVGP